MITVYKSTDASAPALSGSVGSLTALLKACLVNGYGSKPAAGWTNPFSGTNQEVFRPGSGAQQYFGIDDNGSGAGLAKEAQLTGWETMTAWGTNSAPGSNTGPFPTSTQFGGGVVIRKSTTADATARAWTVVADARTCYVFVQTGDSIGNYMGGAFGEFYSLMTTTDAYRSLVIGRQTTNNGTFGTTVEVMPVLNPAAGSSPLPGHYLPRPFSGIGSSTQFRKWGDTARGNATANYNMGSSGLSLPEPVTGAIHVAPIHISETTTDVRGRLRGLFQLCHNGTQAAPNGIPDGATIVGSGAYAGRTFLAVTGIVNQMCYLLDITGPWETN